MDKNLELDQVDFKILNLLIQDATLPYTEIAKQVFVSDGTVHVRMKKLKDLGIIRHAQLHVDYAKLGWDVEAFLGIYLEKSSQYDEVATKLKEIPEVISLNYTTGSYSMLAKIICRDTKHLRDVLHDKVQPIVGIQRTETLISLEASMNRPLFL